MHAQQVRELDGSVLESIHPDVGTFAKSHEFVSLGCWCGVALALDALQLRRNAYPFDWMRSPGDGIHKILGMGCKNMLHSKTQPWMVQGDAIKMDWGGRFVSKDSQGCDLVEKFQRRVSRFFAQGEVLESTPRVFIWVPNSSSELRIAEDLHAGLRQMLPGAEVKLLVLLDCQDATGPMRLKQNLKHLLFYKTIWSQAPDESTLFFAKQIQKFGVRAATRPCAVENLDYTTRENVMERTEAYAQAIVASLAAWLGVIPRSEIEEFACLADLVSTCSRFYGGGMREHYKPRLVYPTSG